MTFCDGTGNRTDDGEVSHADLLRETFLDQRHAGEPFPVTGELLLNRLHKGPWKISAKQKLGALLCRLQVLEVRMPIRDFFRTRRNYVQTHNIIDDLQVPREQVFQQRNRPLLKSFRKDGVVGEEERVGNDLPGVVPRNLLLVDENTHQFWDGESGVCIVELDGSI